MNIYNVQWTGDHGAFTQAIDSWPGIGTYEIQSNPPTVKIAIRDHGLTLLKDEWLVYMPSINVLTKCQDTDAETFIVRKVDEVPFVCGRYTVDLMFPAEYVYPLGVTVGIGLYSVTRVEIRQPQVEQPKAQKTLQQKIERPCLITAQQARNIVNTREARLKGEAEENLKRMREEAQGLARSMIEELGADIQDKATKGEVALSRRFTFESSRICNLVCVIIYDLLVEAKYKFNWLGGRECGPCYEIYLKVEW